MPLITRWRLYWAVVAATMFAAALGMNRWRYKGRSWKYICGMSLFDASLAGLLGAFCPPVLIALCVMWVADSLTQHRLWNKMVAIAAGIGFASIGGIVFEIVLAIGVFAVHLLTGEFVRNFTFFKQKAEQEERLERAA